MIDKRGKALHAIIAILIELEEETFSDPLSEAMENFDSYMNRLNATEGYLYDRYGNVLMVWSTDPSYEIKLVTPENCDAVNPVPIGSSALLLGSSIFGLMGFGLWRKNKILGNE